MKALSEVYPNVTGPPYNAARMALQNGMRETAFYYQHRTLEAMEWELHIWESQKPKEGGKCTFHPTHENRDTQLFSRSRRANRNLTLRIATPKSSPALAAPTATTNSSPALAAPTTTARAQTA
jgi:hypothetical protein